MALQPRFILTLLAAGALAAAGMGGTFAAFSSSASNEGNALTAASDFRAPEVAAADIARSSTMHGFIRQGGTYSVYARVSADTGSPASGTLAVTANVSNVTTGLTAVPLVAGSYTVDGTSYNYKSAPLVADLVLSEGAKSYSITATDNASNSGTLSGLDVTVDNTAPSAADAQTANTGGGTAGRAQQGDTLALTFSEPIDPASILSGWSGASANVVARLTDGGLLGSGRDDIQIRNAANSVALPLGTVDLGRNDYASGLLGGKVDFGASGTPSTMSMSGSTLTITFGTPVEAFLGASVVTAGDTGTMVWHPAVTPVDRAGNQSSTASASESGSADREF